MNLFTNTIEGLYVAFYHRAADQEGLDYWLQRADESTNEDYMYELAAGFAQNSQFEEEYGSFDDENFVKAVYQNVLNGVDDDANAIAYWEDRVDAVGRDGMVAEFVKAVLEYDGDDAEGIARQEFFQNRVDAAKSFTETLAEESNPVNFDHLDQDSAYLASQAVIESVVDNASLESVLAFIEDHNTLDSWGDGFLAADADDAQADAEEEAGNQMDAANTMMGAAADADDAQADAEEEAGNQMGTAADTMMGAAADADDAQADAEEEGNTAAGLQGDENIDYGNLSGLGDASGSGEAYSYNDDPDTASSYTEENQNTTADDDSNDVSLSGVDESHSQADDSAAFGF